MTNTIPNGFNLIERRSPFTDLLGPVYSYLDDDKGLILAIRGENKHCNARGFIHGGVLCTLADIGMGYNTVLKTQNRSGMVTANLSIDYAGSARMGDWISLEVDVQKVGGTLAFANGFFFVNGERIARASAVFCKPRITGPAQQHDKHQSGQ